MPRSLNVHLLPQLVTQNQLQGEIAVVIDVLRASTTIITALAAGAARVIPCRHVDEARAIAETLPPDSTLLGGERGGTKIPGFDLGNSPAEYTPAAVRGKTLVFTTTNGTRALAHASAARRVFVAAFLNRRALCHALADSSDSVHLLCAGTESEISADDTLAAGAIVHYLVHETGAPAPELNDQARLAAAAYENAADRIPETLRTTRGARNLYRLGLENDITTAAQLDTMDVIPELHRDPWQLVALAPPVVSKKPGPSGPGRTTVRIQKPENPEIAI